MVKNNLQIIHCLEQHFWITESTVNNAPGEVTIMDSIFKSIDQETMLTIFNLFQPTGSANQLKVKVIKAHRRRVTKTVVYLQ